MKSYLNGFYYHRGGDDQGDNTTETSQKILELTDQLYDKYLDDGSNRVH